MNAPALKTVMVLANLPPTERQLSPGEWAGVMDDRRRKRHHPRGGGVICA